METKKIVSLMFTCCFLHVHADTGQPSSIADIIKNTPNPFEGYALPENIGFKLVGIVQTGNGKTAALIKSRYSTKTVTEGEQVRGWTIEKIEKEFILISKGDELRELWLIPPL